MPNTSKIYPHHEAWAVAHGYRGKAPSAKLQEGIDYEVDNIDDYIKRVKLQAASTKRQAPSNKRQASSAKLK